MSVPEMVDLFLYRLPTFAHNYLLMVIDILAIFCLLVVIGVGITFMLWAFDTLRERK